MKFATIAMLPGDPAIANSLLISPERAYFACGTCLALLQSAPRFETSQDVVDNAFTALALSPDRSTLAVRRGDGRIELRDPATLKGDVLLLACRERGLWSIPVAAIPTVPRD